MGVNPDESRVQSPPDFDVTISQFELPEVMIESEQDRDKAVHMSRATQIFRERLGQSLLQKNAKSSVTLNDFMLSNTPTGVLTRHDAALGFLQTLVLKTLDVLIVEQVRS